MGALLNVQLKRLPGMIKKMRAERNKILSSTLNLSNMGIKHSPLNSKNYDCGNYVFFKFNNTLDAEKIHFNFPCTYCRKNRKA